MSWAGVRLHFSEGNQQIKCSQWSWSSLCVWISLFLWFQHIPVSIGYLLGFWLVCCHWDTEGHRVGFSAMASGQDLGLPSPQCWMIQDSDHPWLASQMHNETQFRSHILGPKFAIFNTEQNSFLFMLHNLSTFYLLTCVIFINWGSMKKYFF